MLKTSSAIRLGRSIGFPVRPAFFYKPRSVVGQV
jgi:hypothetical protein